MIKHLYPAVAATLLFALLTGIVFPLTITAIASLCFPFQAHGSLLTRGGGNDEIIGSALIGQNFADPRYFHSRPSATTDTDPNDATKTIPSPYNAANSAGSNLAPTAQALVDRVREDAGKLKAEAGGVPIPADLVTTSASGLDPDISPAAALLQVRRVAVARHIPEAALRALVEQSVRQRTLGVLGEPRINVLALNLVLDGLKMH